MSEIYLRKIKSYTRRDGRMTEAQRRVLTELMPLVGLQLENGLLDFAKVFNREAKTIIEIGFGSGYSLLEAAKAHPEHNFIGVEMYQPGIGQLLLGIEEHQLTNIRVFYADAVEVLEKCIPLAGLDGVHIFFPDPWPKRKHHKRRLVQTEFIESLLPKLKSNAVIHVATDWEHYAEHCMRVLSGISALTNLAGKQQYATRSEHRPVVTKFEGRGLRCGRAIRELQFTT